MTGKSSVLMSSVRKTSPDSVFAVMRETRSYLLSLMPVIVIVSSKSWASAIFLVFGLVGWFGRREGERYG